MQPKRKGGKRSAWKSDIVDEDSESGEEDLEASGNSDSENDSDDDYSAPGKICFLIFQFFKNRVYFNNLLIILKFCS